MRVPLSWLGDYVDLPEDATADDVVSAMLARFDQAADDVDLEAGAKALGLTPLEVVTIASLVVTGLLALTARQSNESTERRLLREQLEQSSLVVDVGVERRPVDPRREALFARDGDAWAGPAPVG